MLRRQLTCRFRVLVRLRLVALVASDQMLKLVLWALMLAVGRGSGLRCRSVESCLGRLPLRCLVGSRLRLQGSIHVCHHSLNLLFLVLPHLPTALIQSHRIQVLHAQI